MLTYKQAGVNKQEGHKTVSEIKPSLKKTFSKNVLSNFSNFGALYELNNTYKKPVLVSGTDGVGSKIMIALQMEAYDTIGQDCYAMCANDILCQGAKPLFFLDYLACGKLNSKIASLIVKGLADTCLKYETALIGGETAELTDLLKRDDYDLAGFCVGVVEKSKIISGHKIEENNAVIGLSSSGIHSNGFTLIRKIFTDYYQVFEKKPMYKTLLEPTKVYTKIVLDILQKHSIKGIAHITGGGFIENVPRIIPDGLCAEIDTQSFPKHPIFSEIEKRSQILENEMWGTFNMGIGMVLVVAKSRLTPVLKLLDTMGEEAYHIGNIITNKKEKLILN